MSKLYTYEVQDHILRGDGPNPAALSWLTRTDQHAIGNDRAYLALGNSGAQPYITATVDACAKVLGASRKDMAAQETEFAALARQLSVSGTTPEKHGVEGHAVELITAYVEVSLLHAFSRGTRTIRRQADGGLAAMKGDFTIHTISRMGEMCEKTIHTCYDIGRKADGWMPGFMRSETKKAAAADAKNNALAAADTAWDIAYAASGLLRKMDSHRSDLKWKAPSPKTITKLHRIEMRHRPAVATV